MNTWDICSTKEDDSQLAKVCRTTMKLSLSGNESGDDFIKIEIRILIKLQLGSVGVGVPYGRDSDKLPASCSSKIILLVYRINFKYLPYLP